MSEPDNNTCPTCGGAKVVRFKMEAIPPGMRPKVNPASRLKLCTCPLPRPVHDGKLGGTLRASFGKVYVEDQNIDGVWIEGSDEDGYLHEEEHEMGMGFTPQEALSLLDWLSQNRQKLEQMAQEEDK